MTTIQYSTYNRVTKTTTEPSGRCLTVDLQHETKTTIMTCDDESAPSTRTSNRRSIRQWLRRLIRRLLLPIGRKLLAKWILCLLIGTSPGCSDPGKFQELAVPMPKQYHVEVEPRVPNIYESWYSDTCT